MVRDSDDQTEAGLRRRGRPKLNKVRNYRAIYLSRKQNPAVYEHIKKKNAEWIRTHPEWNRENQKRIRQRRAECKLAERQQNYPGWITVAEAVRMLGISRQRVHQLIHNGELGDTVWYGNRIMVRQSAVEAYRESRISINRLDNRIPGML